MENKCTLTITYSMKKLYECILKEWLLLKYLSMKDNTKEPIP